MQRPLFPALDTPRAARTAPRGRQVDLPLGATPEAPSCTALGCSTRTGHACAPSTASDALRVALMRAELTGPILAARRGAGWTFTRAEVRPDLVGDGVVAIFSVNGRPWEVPIGDLDREIAGAVAESIHLDGDTYTTADDKRELYARHLTRMVCEVRR